MQKDVWLQWSTQMLTVLGPLGPAFSANSPYPVIYWCEQMTPKLSGLKQLFYFDGPRMWKGLGWAVHLSFSWCQLGWLRRETPLPKCFLHSCVWNPSASVSLSPPHSVSSPRASLHGLGFLQQVHLRLDELLTWLLVSRSKHSSEWGRSCQTSQDLV